MKNIYPSSVLSLALCMACSTASAALIDRGNGLIYDTDLDITWLADASYARTSGYDADGLMSWGQSVAWTEQLVYGGFSDWRLPTTTDTGLAGCNSSLSNDECFWYTNPASSEMAHLFYPELGNLGYDINGNPQVGGGLTNSGPFTNIFVNEGYWSGTYHIGLNGAYGFDFVYGVNFANYVGNLKSAWAVHAGDIGGGPAVVPVPAAAWLLGSGIAGLIGFRRKAA